MRRFASVPVLLLSWSVLVVVFLGAPRGARGETPAPPPSASVAAVAPSAVAPVAPAAPAPAAAGDPRTAEVAALVRGELPTAVDPAGLFELRLDDEEAVQIERNRLTRLLRAVDEGAAPATPPSPVASASASAGPVASAAPSALPPEALPVGVDPAQWKARMDLDRARLAFLSLDRERREALLAEHRAKVEAARPSETEEAKRTREAEEERQKALEAARRARSEAERLVSEEEARLIGVEQGIEAAHRRFGALRADLEARSEVLLGWQRRARDAMAGPPEDADATYDGLRKTLRASRDELSGAIDDLSRDASDVPDAGPDRLADIPADVPRGKIDEHRAAIDEASQRVRDEERALRGERASTLLAEVSQLNQERLDLLPYLTADKRSAITGYTAAGLDQARSETRHLFLILRYHRHVAGQWLAGLRHAGSTGISPWRTAFLAIPWLMVVAVFVWWRRRSQALLTLLVQRIARDDRAERRTSPSLLRKLAQFLRSIHSSLEWLLLFGWTVWWTPAGARAVLEVQLLLVVVGYALAGAAIVDVINALSESGDRSRGTGGSESAQIRLRSLRLVGRVVVAFALVLVLSARLVGQGTLYSWVLSTCWFAAIPVFLVLVRWWRATVFERVERVRRKSRVESWVLDNRQGWKSFAAAMVGALHLFGFGIYKTARSWVSGFDIVRRGLAYLFKRDLDRMAQGSARAEGRPLGEAPLAILSPDHPSASWIECPADEAIEAMVAHARDRQGGVYALLGGPGMGKTAAARRLAARCEGALLIAAHPQLTVASVEEAREAAGAPGGGGVKVVILDDAHTLIKPVVGGLAAFDAVSIHARSSCQHTCWIFVVDQVVWPFLRRARDNRPLFDEAKPLLRWDDEQIGELLLARSAEAGVDPDFAALLDSLPPGADEIDRQEALAERRAGYFRMVWDYARGNPAIALEAWRSSLVRRDDEVVEVRPLRAPDPAPLDALPDTALFVLRAVLQMAPVTIADVADATRLSPAQVESAFRYGETHGFLSEDGGRFQVTWSWLRSITLLLERRHLLVNT